MGVVQAIDNNRRNMACFYSNCWSFASKGACSVKDAETFEAFHS